MGDKPFRYRNRIDRADYLRLPDIHRAIVAAIVRFGNKFNVFILIGDILSTQQIRGNNPMAERFLPAVNHALKPHMKGNCILVMNNSQ
jgi:hypothetical protein